MRAPTHNVLRSISSLLSLRFGLRPPSPSPSTRATPSLPLLPSDRAMPLTTKTHSSAFLLPSDSTPKPTATYALVVLNQRLPRFTPLLWVHARLRMCADGGANRLFDGMPELLPNEDPAEVRTRYKPDVIKGDMDSIRPEVKEYYSNLKKTFLRGTVKN